MSIKINITSKQYFNANEKAYQSDNAKPESISRAIDAKQIMINKRGDLIDLEKAKNNIVPISTDKLRGIILSEFLEKVEIEIDYENFMKDAGDYKPQYNDYSHLEAVDNDTPQEFYENLEIGELTELPDLGELSLDEAKMMNGALLIENKEKSANNIVPITRK